MEDTDEWRHRWRRDRRKKSRGVPVSRNSPAIFAGDEIKDLEQRRRRRQREIQKTCVINFGTLYCHPMQNNDVK